MLNLTKLILEIVSNDLSKIEEKPYSLWVYTPPLTINIFNLIKLLNNNDSEGIQSISVNLKDLQSEVSLTDDYKDLYDDEAAIIKIEKKESFGLRFFFEKGFELYLSNNPALEETNYVKLDFIESNFNSYSTLFETPLSTTTKENSILEKVQGIKYTKALSTEAQKYLPTNTLAWISKNPNGQFPKSWQKWSTLKLFCSLCSELHSEHKLIEFYYRGERRKKVTLDLQESDKLLQIFSAVSECADWVFWQSKDIDTRHYLFNHQMTLVLADDEKLKDPAVFNALLKNAFDNAHLAYRYHLQSSSKELTKTLTDLNKTLFEYIGKIRQNAADLVNGLWRDLTTVSALLLLNFSLKKPDVIEQNYDTLGFGLCLYLAFSIFINARMGFWFFRNVKASLNEWKSKIYGYLNDNEFEKFAHTPLNEAFQKYRFTFFIVVTFYVLMIIAVAKYTFWDNFWNYIF